jgi:hypothetical protein
MKYSQVVQVEKRSTRELKSLGGGNPLLAYRQKAINRIDLLCMPLPCCSAVLWSVSLRTVDVGRMNDLGLVSVLSPGILLALGILSISFCLALTRPVLRAPILLFHLLLLIGMLYGITALVEEMPRFDVVYRHAGLTEYITRTGTVDPNLDAYFNWPGFFILSALVTRLAGYQDILGYAAWAPVVFNLLYLAPLYMIFTSATTDRRIVWLGLWFFYLNNWIGQDYFSPQGLNMFMFLAVIAILLKWFKIPYVARSQLRWQRPGRFFALLRKLDTWATTTDMPDTLRPPIALWQRRALLLSLIAIFFFTVFSHPLTPFFVLVDVSALVIFRRCYPFWLPILMLLILAAWLYFMARSYISGHFSDAFGSGGVGLAVTSNLSERVAGSVDHTLIVQLCVLMTMVVWGLAMLGAIRRLRNGYHDIIYIGLALVPFPLIVAQSYGGEMLLRIYLVTLPMMVFFIASLFFIKPIAGKSPWMTVVLVGISCLFLGGFLFTRYGNERMDYMTSAEVEGVHYLYNVAQPGSILIAGWSGSPWQFRAIEQYDTYDMNDVLPEAVANGDVNSVVQFIAEQSLPRSNANIYLLFTRAQKMTVEATTDFPPNALDRLEQALLASGKFKLLYKNTDAQVLVYSGTAERRI